MNNECEKIVNLINSQSDMFLPDISQLQGVEIKVDDFVNIYGFRVLRTFFFIEKVLAFLLSDNGFANVDDSFSITSLTEKGQRAVDAQAINGRASPNTPVYIFLCCDMYIKIPSEIHRYLFLLRNHRNVFAHANVETKPTNDQFNLTYTFIDSFFIFLYWLVNDYLSDKIPNKLKTNALDIIKRGKTILRVLKDRIAGDEETIKYIHSFGRDDAYINYLENRISELELKIEEGNKASQNNDALMAILQKIDKNVGQALEGQQKIINKIDDLTNFVIEQQYEIQKSLEEAQKGNNIEEIERIVNSFSDKVIEEISKKLDKKEIDEGYEVEKEILKATFEEKYWNKLTDRSKNFLITGKLLYKKTINSNKMDFSGVCLLITKAVDNEVHKYLYSNFRYYLQSRYPYPANQDKWPSFFLKSNCYGTSLISDNDFTLGSVRYFCCKDEQPNIDDASILYEYCRNSLFRGCDDKTINKNLEFVSKSIETIRLDYRNPAAHINVINKIKADECLAYILDTTKVLVKLMELFN